MVPTFQCSKAKIRATLELWNVGTLELWLKKQ
jgi:hypothetical protein